MKPIVFLLPPIAPRDRRICSIVDSLQELPGERGYRIEIAEHDATRSEKQNSTIWWLYGEILKVGGNLMAGYIAEELHEFFLGRHFGIKRKTVFGETMEFPNRRSSNLSKTAFAAYMDSIYSFMASQGVVLPLPDPEYWRKAS